MSRLRNENFPLYTVPQIYSPDRGSSNSGYEFEYITAANLSLECCGAKEMWLAMHAKELAGFDDIVLRVLQTDNTSAMYLIQLKYKIDMEVLNQKDFLTYNNTQKGIKQFKPFQLLKYLQCFKKIKDKISISNCQILECLSQENCIRYVLHTNRKVNNCDLLKEVADKKLYFGNGKLYKFNCQNLIKEADDKFHSYFDIDLLENLILYSEPKQIDEGTATVGEKLEKLLQINLNEPIKNAEEYITFVKKWETCKLSGEIKENEQTEVNCNMNNPRSKGNFEINYPLTKDHIFIKLTEMFLKPFIHEFDDGENDYNENALKDINDKKMIIIKIADSHMVNKKTYQRIRRYISDEFNKWYIEHSKSDCNDSNDNDDRLHLFNKINHASCKIIHNHERNVKLTDLHKCLWVQGQLPLILKIRNKREFETMWNILRLSDFCLELKVIVIGDILKEELENYIEDIKKYDSFISYLDHEELIKCEDTKYKVSKKRKTSRTKPLPMLEPQCEVSRVQHRSPESVKKLLRKTPSKINSIKDDYNRTDVHFVAAQGKNDILSDLLIENPNAVNNLDIVNETPLFYAVKNSRYDTVTLLITENEKTKKLFIDNQNLSGNTLLHYAVLNYDIYMVELLIDNNAQTNITNKLGETVLDIVCNVFTTVETMSMVDIKKLSDVAEKCYSIVSMVANTITMTKHKQEAYSKFKQLYENFKQYLMQVIRYNMSEEETSTHSDYTKKTLESFKNILELETWQSVKSDNPETNKETAGKNSPVLMGNMNVSTEKLPLVDYLVSPDGCKHFFSFEELYEAKIYYSPPNTPVEKGKFDKYENSGLHIAVQNQNVEEVRALLKNKDDIESKNKFGRTPLHYIAMKGSYAITTLLLENKADVNVKDNYGRTPLHYAAEANHKDIIDVLVSKTAKINERDESNNTPLIYATRNSHIDSLKLLLEKGANVNKPGFAKKTPLHLATYYNRKEIVNLLLNSKNIKINVQDSNGDTPLYYAIKESYEELIELLLKHGASTTIKNNKGQKADSLI